MAKVALLRSTSARHLIYSVDEGVGPGRPNRRSDVLLVQYFLRESFKGTPKFQREPFPEVVKVDGVAGRQTFAAIDHFQKVLKKGGSSIATDGRVDPVAGDQTHGAISGTQYTIIFLNQGFSVARPGDWPRVSRAGDCPGDLRPLLVEPEFVK